jgi:hypothetical protein
MLHRAGLPKPASTVKLQLQGRLRSESAGNEVQMNGLSCVLVRFAIKTEVLSCRYYINA